MKMKLVTSAFAALCLTASLAAAAPSAAPAPAAGPATPALADGVLFSPLDGQAGCTDEPDFLRTPDEQGFGICGSCSGVCAGGSVNQLCGFSGGRWYACEIPFAEACTDGKPRCYCWTGPLP